jgi:ribokinase
VRVLDLVAVGDVMLDVLAPPGAVGAHAPIRVRAGGSAVNAARTAIALGATVAVVGRVGDDAIGRAIAAELAGLGIEALLAFDAAAPTGTAVYRGEVLVADRGANAGCTIGTLPAARATLVSAYLPDAAVRAALAAASGIRALDLQGISDDARGAGVVLGPGIDLSRYAGAEAACSTLGADGAEAIAGTERASARPPVRREGSLTGAGDAFAAAFVLALADGAPLAAALAAGCAAGSSVETQAEAAAAVSNTRVP